MDEIKEMLSEEIKKQIEDLSELDPGNEEKSKAIDNVVKLYKLTLEKEKASCDSENERNQLNEQKRDRYVKIGIAAAEIILPLIFYGAWIGKGLRFEKDGSFTSTTFKNLISKFRPTK